MVSETEFLLFLDVKAGQGPRKALALLRTYKVETRLQGCLRVVQLSPCLQPSTTSEHDGRVCVSVRAPAPAASAIRPVKAHGRVDTLEWAAGSPIDHLSVSDFSSMAKRGGKPASAPALAPWALVVKRVPSSQAQRTPEVGPGPVVLSTTLEAHWEQG